MTKNDDPFLLLARANPVTEVDPARLDDVESEALLQRITMAPREDSKRSAGGPPRRSAGSRRRRVVPVVVAATVLAVLALPASRVLQGWLPDGSSATAATPELLTTAHAPRERGAAARLRVIVDRAQGLPDDVGSGAGVEVGFRTWSLFTRIDGVDVRSRVVPEDVVRSLDGAGEGTITTTVVDDDGDRRTTSDTVDEGPVSPLPTSLPELTRVLAERNPSSAAGRLNGVVETLLERPAGPAARAVILRYLAATPGLTTVGATTDRAGRDGIGFAVTSSASGLPTRYLMVIDPDTGTILGYEEMLTKDAGELEVPIPSVIQYIVWDTARFR